MGVSQRARVDGVCVNQGKLLQELATTRSLASDVVVLAGQRIERGEGMREGGRMERREGRDKENRSTGRMDTNGQSNTYTLPCRKKKIDAILPHLLLLFSVTIIISVTTAATTAHNTYISFFYHFK